MNLNSWANRNSLITCDTSQNQYWIKNFATNWDLKSLTNFLRDSFLWVLDDATDKKDLEQLWDYWVFSPIKAINPSYIMFWDFIKFVKLSDKSEYLSFAKRKIMVKLLELNEDSFEIFNYLRQNQLLDNDEIFNIVIKTILENKQNILSNYEEIEEQDDFFAIIKYLKNDSVSDFDYLTRKIDLEKYLLNAFKTYNNYQVFQNNLIKYL